FVSAGGGSIGLLAGGALTQSLDWHWIFFVNVPIGLIAFLLGSALIEENRGIGLAGGVDIAGSVLITLATMLGAFAIVKSTEYGILSARTLGVGGVALVLLGLFFALEARISNPIMPLRILRLRMLVGLDADADVACFGVACGDGVRHPVARLRWKLPRAGGFERGADRQQQLVVVARGDNLQADGQAVAGEPRGQ